MLLLPSITPAKSGAIIFLSGFKSSTLKKIDRKFLINYLINNFIIIINYIY